MVSAGVVLKRLAKELAIESAIKLSELEAKWEKIFDESLTKHIYPSDIKDDILYINVDSPIWIQELTYMKKELEEKLKNFSPSYSFKDIIFKTGRIPKNKRPLKCKTDTKDETISPKEVPEWADELLNEIKDGYLKESLRNIVAINLLKSGG